MDRRARRREAGGHTQAGAHAAQARAGAVAPADGEVEAEAGEAGEDEGGWQAMMRDHGMTRHVTLLPPTGDDRRASGPGGVAPWPPVAAAVALLAALVFLLTPALAGDASGALAALTPLLLACAVAGLVAGTIVCAVKATSIAPTPTRAARRAAPHPDRVPLRGRPGHPRAPGCGRS